MRKGSQVEWVDAQSTYRYKKKHILNTADVKEEHIMITIT